MNKVINKLVYNCRELPSDLVFAPYNLTVFKYFFGKYLEDLSKKVFKQ